MAKRQQRKAQRQDRPLLPVLGRYGHVPPAGLDSEGPYYTEDQQRALGIDQNGVVTNMAQRARTAGKHPEKKAPAKALKPQTEKQRTEAQQKALEKASAETEHNNQVFQAVWAGKKGRAALMYEDQGGELKRVGYPDGYTPEPASAAAHDQLFGKGAAAVRAAAPAAKAPRPERPARPAGGGGGSRKFTGKERITVLAKANPKKAGSKVYERFGWYYDGMTTGEYLKKGGNTGDLERDAQFEFIKISE